VLHPWAIYERSEIASYIYCIVDPISGIRTRCDEHFYTIDIYLPKYDREGDWVERACLYVCVSYTRGNFVITVTERYADRAVESACVFFVREFVFGAAKTRAFEKKGVEKFF